MTLQQSWDEEEKANAVTTIFGYNENENPRHSAIPSFFDEWFHGDFKTNRPDDLSNALGSKSLEEYTNQFPDYRINSAVEIGFNTDGETILDYEVQMTNPDDSSTPGGLSPITLEGASNEPNNPFRNEFDYDGSQNYLTATVKGPHTKIRKTDPIDGIEGIRVSIILGGKDPYLTQVKEDVESAAALAGFASSGGSGLVPAAVSRFLFHVTTFYTFLDFVLMADGAKVVRIWDASRYPAHALYVGEDLKDQNEFREGVDWTVDGPTLENEAFVKFGHDGNRFGVTPFDQGGSLGYRNFYTAGYGPHPVMRYTEPGSTLLGETVGSELSDPMFPDDVDNPDVI